MPIPIAIGAAGIAAASGIAGSVLDFFGNKGAQRDQYKNQKKLNAQANEYNRQNALEAYQRQIDFYKTYQSPAAQMQQYEDAGLNPALAYGMGASGGGGAGRAGTVPQAAGAQSGNAASRQTNFAMAGLGLADIAANIKLKEAQAKNLDADTQNKPLQGKETVARTENFAALTAKAGAETAGQELDNAFQRIENTIADSTKQLRIDRIQYETDTAFYKFEEAVQQLEQAAVDTEIKKATKQQVIEQFNANLANTYADTALKYIQGQAAKDNVTLRAAELDVMRRELQLAGQREINSMTKAQAGMNLERELALERMKVERMKAILNSLTSIGVGGLLRGARGGATASEQGGTVTDYSWDTEQGWVPKGKKVSESETVNTK